MSFVTTKKTTEEWKKKVREQLEGESKGVKGRQVSTDDDVLVSKSCRPCTARRSSLWAAAHVIRPPCAYRCDMSSHPRRTVRRCWTKDSMAPRLCRHSAAGGSCNHQSAADPWSAQNTSEVAATHRNWNQDFLTAVWVSTDFFDYNMYLIHSSSFILLSFFTMPQHLLS